MQHNMSVNEYNAVYLRTRQEIHNLPHIDVFDATAQATIYSSGLHEHLKSKLASRLDIFKRCDVTYLMALMIELVFAIVTTKLLLGKPFCSTHAATRESDRPSVALQLRRKAVGHSSPSQTTQISKQKSISKKSQLGKKLVAIISKHPSHERLGAPQPEKQLQRLGESATLSVKGMDGKWYPNKGYRQYATMNCKVNKLCIGRFKSGTHPIKQCPNPEVSNSLARFSNAIVASAELSKSKKRVQKIAVQVQFRHHCPMCSMDEVQLWTHAAYKTLFSQLRLDCNISELVSKCYFTQLMQQLH